MLIFLIISISLSAQHTELSLFDVIEQAKNQSPSAKAAETRKENLFWQYRTFRSNYNPSLNLSGNLPGYSKEYFSNRLDNGDIAFQSIQQINSSLNLGLVQPLSFSGGEISLNSSLSQFNDLNNSNLKRYNSTLFNVQFVQPIFGFNQLKWDKRTEPLRYEESKRSYVEEMEFISREATDRYFDYLESQINLQIAEFNLANNDTIYKIEEGRYNMGTTSKNNLLQVELQLLRSQQDVAQAKLDLQIDRLLLRSYIALQDSGSMDFELLLPSELPEFDIPIEEALLYARQNRADFIAFERRKAEANREVARARAQRFQTNLIASFGLNDAAPMLNDAYIDPVDQQRVNLTLSIPILDWGRSKARVQTALANQQLTQYLLTQDIQTFEQEILTQVRSFEVLRLQVKITEKSNEVAQERYDAAQNRYLIGKIDITNLNIALTEKDDARRSYINALRAFWTAYFDLRRLTLYDFLNDELLYQERD